MEEHLEKSSFAITFCFFSVFIVLLKNNGMGGNNIMIFAFISSINSLWRHFAFAFTM